MNQALKQALKENNVKQWELAKALQISEFSLSRKLRNELSQDEFSQYLLVIKHLKAKSEVN